MTNYTAIDFKQLKQYESFSSVAEMDKSTHNYIEYLQGKGVRQSVIDVLLCLGRASLRVVGVSFMKQDTIAANINLSRKTVNRALKTLEQFGVIDSVRTKTKKDGRPSVKVVRILPFCLERLHQAVTSMESEEVNGDNGLTLVENFEPIFTESKKHLKEIDKEPIESLSVEELDESFVPATIVEKDFVKVAKPFFGASKIFKLWGIVKNVMKQTKLESVTQDVIESVKEAFKATVFMYKANRIRSTFEKYFFGVLSSMLAAVKRKEVFANGGSSVLLYDWITEGIEA